MDHEMNRRRVWTRIILAAAATVLMGGVGHPALAAKSPADSPKAAPTGPPDRRLAQELARSLLARMTAAATPGAECEPETLDSLRAAASAAIDTGAPTRDVALAAVALAKQQAPASDPCLPIALDDTAAELDGEGATVDDAAAVRGFTLYTGSLPPPKGVRRGVAEPPTANASPPARAGPAAGGLGIRAPVAAGSGRHAGAAAEASPAAAAPPASTAPSGSSALAATPTAPAPRGVVADVSSQVQKLPIVYQPPKVLLLHRPVSFKLVIEALGTGSSKAAFSGDTVTSHAQISRTVTATLSAPAGVTITPLSPATQKVTDIANPTWLWDVTAESPNAANLELSIASLVTIDGVDSPVPIEVYNAQIPVQLSVLDRMQVWIGQVDPIWKWLIGVITVAGGGIGWVLNWRLKLRRGGAKGKGQAKPDPA